jgi:hypothetical protein
MNRHYHSFTHNKQHITKTLTHKDRVLLIEASKAFEKSEYITDVQANVLLRVFHSDYEMRVLVKLLNQTPMTAKEIVALLNLLEIPTNSGNKWKFKNYCRYEQDILKRLKTYLISHNNFDV